MFYWLYDLISSVSDLAVEMIDWSIETNIQNSELKAWGIVVPIHVIRMLGLDLTSRYKIKHISEDKSLVEFTKPEERKYSFYYWYAFKRMLDKLGICYDATVQELSEIS